MDHKKIPGKNNSSTTIQTFHKFKYLPIIIIRTINIDDSKELSVWIAAMESGMRL
jgi:hypothetical protein